MDNGMNFCRDTRHHVGTGESRIATDLVRGDEIDDSRGDTWAVIKT